MATIFRTWSYQYPWLYNLISYLAAIPVGGDRRFRHLALEDLKINSETKILDLCCGSGQTTGILVKYSELVTGLDASGVGIKTAQVKVPQAKYVQGLAENMPFEDGQFDLVHTSVALHEMNYEQLCQIFKEVYRVLKSGGVFTFIDLHKPSMPLFWPPLAIFMWLFETETAWQLLELNLEKLLQESGFTIQRQKIYAGGSLQVIQARK